MKKLWFFWIGLLCAANLFAAIEVVPQAPDRTTDFAVTELRDALDKSVKRLTVDGREINRIVLNFSDRTLGNRFVISASGDTVTIRGGLYSSGLAGVFEFIEKVIGVRWFWIDCADYPAARDITLSKLDIDRKLPFIFREVSPQFYFGDVQRYAARNQSNDQVIPSKQGGIAYWGNARRAHTYEIHVPKAQYFAEHPEYFSQNTRGQRVAGMTAGQLCLSNPELRKVVLENFRKYIEKADGEAKAKGEEPPLFYDFSMNDNFTACQCPECLKFVAEKGTQTDLTIDFLNFLAADLATFRPGKFLTSLAYMYNEELPKTVKPAENIYFFLCDGQSDQGNFDRFPSNQAWLKRVADWGKLASGVLIWDYSVLYNDVSDLPLPSEYTYPDLMRYYADHGVKGVYWEHEFRDRGDMHELKHYLELKYMADPYRTDFDALLNDFMTNFYGAAAPHILNYRRMLKKSAEKPRYTFNYDLSNAPWVDYITLDEMLAMQEALNQAEVAVAADPTLSLRVKRARLPLDRLFSLELPHVYMAEWEARGKKAADFPIDLKAMQKKTMALLESENAKLPARDVWYQRLHNKLAPIAAMPGIMTGPAKFKGQKIVDVPPQHIICSGAAKLAPMPDAEGGYAIQITVPEGSKLYNNPLLVGFYNRKSGKEYAPKRIKIENPGQFAWYNIGTVKTEEWTRMFITESWNVNFYLTGQEGHTFDWWINAKVDGPLFGGTGDANTITIARLVGVVK